MRALVDMIDSVTGTVRFLAGLFALCVFAFVLIMTAGVSYMAPKVTEEATQSATAFGERALAEAREERREHELAQDGWGYGSAAPASGGQRSERGGRGNDRSEGWGDAAQ